MVPPGRATGPPLAHLRLNNPGAGSQLPLPGRLRERNGHRLSCQRSTPSCWLKVKESVSGIRPLAKRRDSPPLLIHRGRKKRLPRLDPWCMRKRRKPPCTLCHYCAASERWIPATHGYRGPEKFLHSLKSSSMRSAGDPKDSPEARRDYPRRYYSNFSATPRQMFDPGLELRGRQGRRRVGSGDFDNRETWPVKKLRLLNHT
jgi:hypothetical protein